MCLFKRDDQENTCIHDECKNYYTLNKQMCMYSDIASQHKRPQAVGSVPEESTLEALRKKIKADSEARKVENDAQTLPGQVYQPMNLQGFQQIPTKEAMNPVILNAFMQPKPEVCAQPPTNPLFIPFMNQGVFPGQMVAEQNFKLPPTQFMNLKPQTGPVILQNFNSGLPYESSHERTSKSECSSQSPSGEGFMKEFQSKLLNLLLSQNKILVDLKEKNEVLQDTLACLITEVNSLKTTVKVNNVIDKPVMSGVSPAFSHPLVGVSSDNVTADNLITYLYGNNTDFEYQLVLKNELQLPLYRERNFKFTLMLVDKNGNLVENMNRIPLTIKIYSSENPPKYIDSNTSGVKILKGFIDKDMVNGLVTFDKIQIKEVTSHFRNGWVFFVVHPKVMTGINAQSGANVIPSQKIRPLVLEKVVVKAKKNKDKKSSNETEDNNSGTQEDEAKEAENEQECAEETIYSNQE